MNIQEEQRTADGILKETPLLKPTYLEYGPVYMHNMPCAVLSDTHHAVLDCNTGVFHPSWTAHSDGWHLVKATSKFQRWLLKTFFKEL